MMALEELPHHDRRVDFLPRPRVPEAVDANHADLAAIRASFVYCDSALARVDETKLADQIPFYGGRMASRFQALLSLSMDWADHYSQQAMYLRLNGLLPPSARPRP